MQQGVCPVAMQDLLAIQEVSVLLGHQERLEVVMPEVLLPDHTLSHETVVCDGWGAGSRSVVTLCTAEVGRDVPGPFLGSSAQP